MRDRPGGSVIYQQVLGGVPAVIGAEFAEAMAALGPFEPAPWLAAAVSGGPDSMALALLAAAWVSERGGSLLALIVDHGLRPEAAAEAVEAARRLATRDIAARILTLSGLARGAALAERARSARYAALAEACAAQGILHLLLGHQAADQAETVQIRALGGSGPAGLAAMAPLVETRTLRLLRPLLAVPPARLRALLREAAMGWAEDPSNADASGLRPRLRALRADRDGVGSATAALGAAAAASLQSRTRHAAAADCLAEHVAFYPQGFALVLSGIEARALAAVIQAIGGAPFPPPTASVSALAAAPRPATLAGVRLLPAGRLGQGFLVVREAAAMAPPVPARHGAIWDGRFRLLAEASLPAGATLGALGTDAARLRGASDLPAAVLQTMPALRRDETLIAVPHLLYPDPEACAHIDVVFSPPQPAAGASYWAAGPR